jgi:hypothetical protein
MSLKLDIENRLKLSSGSTLVNLACSGNPNWAMISGGYYWMVGDSSSGKTVFTMGFLAEASINPAFKDYDLIFDNGEDGALMPVEKFYGARLVKRLQPPAVKDGEPVYSRTVEDFHFNIDDRIEKSKKSGKPFIYLLDSMDSLEIDEEEVKFQALKRAVKKGKRGEVAGEYGGVPKAKMNSQRIRSIRRGLRATNSILIILSQTRDKIGATKFQKQKTHAGGHALKFYAHWQLWSNVKGDVTKYVNGKERQIGIYANVSIEKNRISGKEWKVTVPFLWSHGLDDMGACIDYLLDEKRWSADNGVITAEDFKFKGKREELIEKIENDNAEKELRCIVVETWKTIEHGCHVKRKNKYA